MIASVRGTKGQATYRNTDKETSRKKDVEIWWVRDKCPPMICLLTPAPVDWSLLVMSAMGSGIGSGKLPGLNRQTTK